MQKAFPLRIQGTDGVRGKIVFTNRLTAEWDFVHEGVISPLFFERYAYAWASLLLEQDIAKKGEAVVLGQDSRDPSEQFAQAAIRGINKAGLKVWNIGILPTPAVPLFMMSQQASGGIMLTASHNPPDQHGIKLFHAKTGLKFLPLDDKLLTQKIFSLPTSLDDIIFEEKTENLHRAASNTFIRLHASAIEKYNTQKFPQSLYIIDAAKGAASNIVKEIFDQLDAKIIYTNCSLSGKINSLCGVADLEGRTEISIAETKLGNPFYGYETLTTLFEYGERFERGENAPPVGLILDGDADRCFRIDYDPQGKKLKIASGDHLASIFLQTDLAPFPDSLLWNTVESDIAVSLYARFLGVTPKVLSVGDKFILFEAFRYFFSSAQHQGHLKDNQTLFPFTRNIEEKHLNQNFEQEHLPKFMGYEESGHFIFPEYIDSKQYRIPFLSGNGIYTALRSLSAYQQIAVEKTKKITYTPGISKTFYVYQVNKSILSQPNKSRDKLVKNINEVLNQYSSQQNSLIIFEMDPDMLYWQFEKNKKIIGAIFARNSGTEDKAALYLRRDPHDTGNLEDIFAKLYLMFYNTIKRKEGRHFQFTKEILFAPEQTELIRQRFPEIDTKEILKQMTLKEQIIQGKFRTVIGEKLLHILSSPELTQ